MCNLGYIQYFMYSHTVYMNINDSVERIVYAQCDYKGVGYKYIYIELDSKFRPSRYSTQFACMSYRKTIAKLSNILTDGGNKLRCLELFSDLADLVNYLIKRGEIFQGYSCVWKAIIDFDD